MSCVDCTCPKPVDIDALFSSVAARTGYSLRINMRRQDGFPPFIVASYQLWDEDRRSYSAGEAKGDSLFEVLREVLDATQDK